MPCASAIRSSFVSCLSSTDHFFHKKNSVGKFFTDKKNHLAVKMSKTEFRDKCMKLADPCLDLAGEIAKASGASDSTLVGIEKGALLGESGARHLRDLQYFCRDYSGACGASQELLCPDGGFSYR